MTWRATWSASLAGRTGFCNFCALHGGHSGGVFGPSAMANGANNDDEATDETFAALATVSALSEGRFSGTVMAAHG